MATEYTQADKVRAYRVYHQSGGIEKTVTLMTGIPEKTIKKWKKEYDWDQRITMDDQDLAEQFVEGNIDDVLQEIEEFCEEFEIDVVNRKTLEGVTQIEGICFAAIYGDSNLAEKVALRPVDFEAALKGLRLCWETKNKIFSKVTPTKKDEEEGGKVNYLRMVAEAGGARSQETRDNVVAGPFQNTKR